MKNKKNIGFTIIELLAAVVIVGIIVSLAVIVINKYILQGHDAVDSQLEKQLILATKSYYTDNKNKFITNNDTVVVWYTTLRAENYMTNDLVDSKGNSCAKSYVVVKKDSTKYSYSSCVLCDNGGYNNTKGKKECTDSLKNNIYCEWTDDNGNKLNKVYLGVKKNNQVTLRLTCKGRNIKFSNGAISLDVDNMISTKFGKISKIDYNAATNSKNEVTSFVSDIKYTTLPNADGNDIVSFKENSAYVLDNIGQRIPNAATIYDGIVIDGKGPSCKLTGPYNDMNLKTSVKAVKSGSSVYYGLTCKDDNNINGSIEKTGFNSSSSISSIDIVSRPKNNNTEKSAVIKVTVVKGNDSKLTLKYKKDELKDDLDNGNESVSSKIDGKETTLVIDDQAPTCSFNGPSENALFEVAKKFFDVTNGKTEFAFYELKCTDENGIDPSTFKFSDIKNNGFSKIEQSGDMLAVENNENIIIGYRYLIKAYKVSSLSDGPYDAYLTYNRSNLKDTVGNSGVGTDKSRTVKMIDGKQIPSCKITSSDKNGYKLLTGTINSKYKIVGYKWNYDSPSYEGYTNSSSTTTTYNAYNSGFYYLSVIDEYGLEGYCDSEYVYILAPDTPILTANYDRISSGSWHKSSFSLSASSDESNVTYYYGDESYNVTSVYEPSINSETSSSGEWYYAKACWANNPQVCSSNAQYLAKLDMTPPTCSVSMTKSGNCAASGEEYKSGKWTQCDVDVSVSNCVDDLSGISSGSSSYSTSYTSECNKKVSVDSITDKAGNAFTSSQTIRIDRTDPVPNLSCDGDSCTFSCYDLNGISCITYAVGPQSSGVNTGGSCTRGDDTNAGKNSIEFKIPDTYKSKVTVVGECTDYARNGKTDNITNYDPNPSTVTCSLSVTNERGQEIYSHSSQDLTISGTCESDTGEMVKTYLDSEASDTGKGVIDPYGYDANSAWGNVDGGHSRTIKITLAGYDNKGGKASVTRTIKQTK